MKTIAGVSSIAIFIVALPACSGSAPASFWFIKGNGGMVVDFDGMSDAAMDWGKALPQKALSRSP